METLNALLEKINLGLWDYLLILVLCGSGIYLSIRLRFVQVRKFPYAMRQLFSQISLSGKKAGERGMSSFQALATAVAAQVGTGNLVGAATAILAGGPGAVFWMWVSAFFGMATIFQEATLAITCKQMKDGEVVGGPVYYIRRAFRGRLGAVLAVCFSVFLIIALGFMGNMVQSNSISSAFENVFGIPPVVVGIAVALLTGAVVFGGIRRIASFTEKIVPLMAVLYILGSLVVVVYNAPAIPGTFYAIFKGAFAPRAVMGGIFGATVKQAIRYGVARGLFSNEAGMGSTPHAHALAKVDHPCQQGMIAMMGVFFDTFVILTLTALVLLTSPVLGNGQEGIALVQSAFESVFGAFGGVFIAICLFFFAFSTIIGWYFFGQANIRYLFGKKAIGVYTALVLVFLVLGAVLKLDLVWNLADLFNGLMVIPNILGLIVLTGIAASLLRDFENNRCEVRLPDKAEPHD